MKTNPFPQLPLQLTQLMAQSTTRLQELPRWSRGLNHWLQTSPQLAGYRRLSRPINRSLLISSGLLLLWPLWQGLLALGLGLLVTVGVYLAQQGQLKSWRPWQQLQQRLWSRANRALSLAGLAGLVTAGTVYLALALWIELDHSWLAIGLILQGLGLLAILSLLLWRQVTQDSRSASCDVSRPDYLTQLSAEDALQRLIAVRQLTQLAQQTHPPLARSALSECLRLMLDRELEPRVCHALIESLQQLNPTRKSELGLSIKPTRVVPLPTDLE